MTQPTIRESARVFRCEGDSLVGVITVPGDSEPDTGVLVIVGGPQYRAGSHRLFVHLSRRLAASGIASLRFDCRGMGDSEGRMRTFEDIDLDIRAAVDTFAQAVPSAVRIVLWGLCDGASAACFYAPTDPRIAGVVLANPWVRTDATKAEAYLRHYYLRRLGERAFWRKFLSGRFSVTQSVRAFRKLIQASRTRIGTFAGSAGNAGSFRALPFPQSMAEGLARFSGDVLIILCGNDYTAAEFRDVAKSSCDWNGALGNERVTWRDMKDADHTFSTESWRDEVAALTVDWLCAELS